MGRTSSILSLGLVRLVLASSSPRRAELLRAAGFTFDTLVVDIDEGTRPYESPENYVRRIAMDKSAAATRSSVVSGFRGTGEDPVILTADTAVVVDGEILGKPRDDRDAAAMLGRLSGRVHQVMTGVSVRTKNRELGRVERTAVEFARLSDEEISWYVASGEGRDKAGAYAIQGLASRFVPRIEGSYSNVVGLPVACVFELLKETGFLASPQ
jgi:nucleoside triphosphate pyrophosphatase